MSPHAPGDRPDPDRQYELFELEPLASSSPERTPEADQHAPFEPSPDSADPVSPDASERPEIAVFQPPSYTLHSPFNVGWATFWGGPAAGGFLMTLNFWRQGHRLIAPVALAGGVLLTIAMMQIDLTRVSGRTVVYLPLIGVVIMRAAAGVLQGQAFNWHVARGGRAASAWSAFGFGLLSLGLLIVGAFTAGVSFPRLFDSDWGQKIYAGAQQEIYYADGATESNAKKLLNCLQLVGYFKGQNPLTVRLTKKDDGFGIAFVVKSFVFTDSESIVGFKEIAQRLAEEFAPGQPVTVQLCDEFMTPHLTLPTVVGRSTAAWQASIEAGKNAKDRGDIAEAEIQFQLALNEAEHLGTRDIRLAESLYWQATVLQHKAAYAAAGEAFARAVRVAEQARGSEHVEMAGFLQAQARNLLLQGNAAEAEPLLKRALRLRENRPHGKPGELVEILNLLGSACWDLAKYAEQEGYLTRAASICDSEPRIPGGTKAWTLASLAALKRSQGRLKEAEDLYLRAAAILNRTAKPDEFDLGEVQEGLAHLYSDEDRFAEAEALFNKVLAINEKAYGADHPNVAEIRLSLGWLHLKREKWALAESLARRSLADSEKTLAAGHLQVVDSLMLIAAACSRQGKIEQSEEAAKRALEICEKTLGENHPLLASNLVLLASVMIEKQDFAQAKRLLKRSLTLVESTRGLDIPLRSNVLTNLGIACHSLGEVVEAESYYKQAIALKEKIFGPEHSSLVAPLVNLSLLLREAGRDDQADAMEKRARAIRKKHFKDKPLDPLPKRTEIG